MGGSIPMTREAYQRKRDEVEHMEKVQMPEIAEKIAAAREEGDLKENAEYHAQREAGYATSENQSDQRRPITSSNH